MIVGPPSSEKAYLWSMKGIKLKGICSKDKILFSLKGSSPSIMHERAIVIWTVEIVSHLLPEVV